jgi:hypothetical protein
MFILGRECQSYSKICMVLNTGTTDNQIMIINFYPTYLNSERHKDKHCRVQVRCKLKKDIAVNISNKFKLNLALRWQVV